MLYDWTSTAALGVVRDIQPKEPLTLTGEGLWVCLISSGRCTASLTDASPSPDGKPILMTVYLSAITPACATVTSMAQLYDRDASHSSAIYVLSTLLSILTMPLMIGLFELLL